MTKPTLLILAAGIGSRYGSLKQLDKLGPGGETIIDYSVFDAKRAGFGKVVFVIRQSMEQEFQETLMKKLSAHIAVDYVLQEIEKVPEGIKVHPERVKPWGTGHAILMAKDVVKEPFAVINADDFYGADAFHVLCDHLKIASEGNYAMVGYQLENTLSENGTVSRGICESDDNLELQSITERTKIAGNGSTINYVDDEGIAHILDPKTIVSMNCWGFTPGFFSHLQTSFDDFIQHNAQTLKGEFYIPVVVNDLIKSNQAIVKVLQSSAKWFGVTYREDREYAVQQLQQLTSQGVYPADLWSGIAD
ncbi:MAG: NTP transferase domain-containing protein [Bacteroidales bacterium]|nr:NTP transferase domain-containing protein [Bacteroidales bacterium]